MRTSIALLLLLAGAAAATAAQPGTRPTDEARGEELYRRHCVSCHGVRNGGQGPATTALVHPVPALQGKVAPNDETVKVVLRGKGAMPGFEASFDRADAVRVLKYMKSLGPEKALPAQPVKKAPTRLEPTAVGVKNVEAVEQEQEPEGDELREDNEE